MRVWRVLCDPGLLKPKITVSEAVRLSALGLVSPVRGVDLTRACVKYWFVPSATALVVASIGIF